MADIKFDNPNFNKEKYGKYFDDNGKIKDFKGWLDARNNDLKSASDPADLVNKINSRDNQVSLNKIKGKNFEKALDRFSDFMSKQLYGGMGFWLDTFPDRYDQFDDDIKAQFDAIGKKKYPNELARDKDELKLLTRLDDEAGYSLFDQIRDVYNEGKENLYLGDDELNTLVDILNELTADGDDGYTVDELRNMNNDFYTELAHAFDDSSPNKN